VTRVGVLGPGTIDIIELPGHEPVQRPGGTTLYAARALRFAGAEPVVIENPGLVISRLRRTEEGTVQAIDRVAEPAEPGWLAERLDRFDGCSWVMLGGQTIGEFRMAHTRPRVPSFEVHAAAELFAQLFAMRLEIDRLKSQLRETVEQWAGGAGTQGPMARIAGGEDLPEEKGEAPAV